MNIYQAVASQLKTSTTITAYTSGKVYPLVVPQGVRLPYITYRQVSNVVEHAMIRDPKISMRRFQISVWSTGFSQSVNISTAIKAVLRDKTGTLGSSNFNVQRIFFDDENDFPELSENTNVITYHRASDYLIWTTG